jgi:hypothetical protein
MLFLSGKKIPGRPLLLTPATNYSLEGVPIWAADNGCFTGQYPGDEAYLRWLARLAPHKDRCLFVAAPDVVGDAEATMVRWKRMAGRIRKQGWPVALVLQDGARPEHIVEAMPDGLFIGGSDEFKLGSSVRHMIAEFPFLHSHMGRVNSQKRMRYARMIGCCSSDGTVLAFDPGRPMFQWGDEIGERRGAACTGCARV